MLIATSAMTTAIVSLSIVLKRKPDSTLGLQNGRYQQRRLFSREEVMMSPIAKSVMAMATVNSSTVLLKEARMYPWSPEKEIPTPAPFPQEKRDDGSDCSRCDETGCEDMHCDSENLASEGGDLRLIGLEVKQPEKEEARSESPCAMCDHTLTDCEEVDCASIPQGSWSRAPNFTAQPDRIGSTAGDKSSRNVKLENAVWEAAGILDDVQKDNQRKPD